MSDPALMHIGRSWRGSTHLEDTCPCPKAPCGLVDRATVSDDCPEHAVSAMKTMRQGHSPENCPQKEC